MASTSARPRINIAMGAALAIGVVWIALAASALWSALQGLRTGRGDWALGWGLVGGLLLAAGVVAIAGTWWHLNRVAPRDRA